MGRSPDCQITIEDPLISRQHAKIVVTESVCTFVDLGSRNGSKVNGQSARQPIVLHDSDRIRLGAQELVFFEMGSPRRAVRATGAMRLCSHCGAPYAEGAVVCPHCGESDEKQDETISGVVVEPRKTWVLALMGEVLERTMHAQKFDEASRILQRAVDEFSDHVARGDSLDMQQLTAIAGYALRLAELERKPRWLEWVLNTFGDVNAIPPVRLLGPIELAASANAEGSDYIRGFVYRIGLKARSLGSEEALVLDRLAFLGHKVGP